MSLYLDEAKAAVEREKRSIWSSAFRLATGTFFTKRSELKFLTRAHKRLNEALEKRDQLQHIETVARDAARQALAEERQTEQCAKAQS